MKTPTEKRLARIKAGYTLEDVAKELKVSEISVRRYESQDHFGYLTETMSKIEDFYHWLNTMNTLKQEGFFDGLMNRGL